ncbi:MAG: LPS export ABC transporter periplasmic protein LptC [candidate division Zixibacteria bacterium]
MTICTEMKRYLTYMVAVSAVLSLLFGCSTEQREQMPQSTVIDTIRPDTEIYGATIHRYAGATLTTSIYADTIRKYDLLDSTMGYNISIDIYDSSGTPTSQLIGDSGWTRDRTEEFHVYGHVVLITEESGRLETDSLYFDPRTDSVFTDAFVKIMMPNDTVSGFGLESNRALTGFKILNQVSGTIVRPADEVEL